MARNSLRSEELKVISLTRSAISVPVLGTLSRRTGLIWTSNVSSLREMVDLVLISRAYEANQKVIGSVDQLMGKVLETLG